MQLSLKHRSQAIQSTLGAAGAAAAAAGAAGDGAAAAVAAFAAAGVCGRATIGAGVGHHILGGVGSGGAGAGAGDDEGIWALDCCCNVWIILCSAIGDPRGRVCCTPC